MNLPSVLADVRLAVDCTTVPHNQVLDTGSYCIYRHAGHASSCCWIQYNGTMCIDDQLYETVTAVRIELLPTTSVYLSAHTNADAHNMIHVNIPQGKGTTIHATNITTTVMDPGTGRMCGLRWYDNPSFTRIYVVCSEYDIYANGARVVRGRWVPCCGWDESVCITVRLRSKYRSHLRKYPVLTVGNQDDERVRARKQPRCTILIESCAPHYPTETPCVDRLLTIRDHFSKQTLIVVGSPFMSKVVHNYCSTAVVDLDFRSTECAPKWMIGAKNRYFLAGQMCDFQVSRTLQTVLQENDGHNLIISTPVTMFKKWHQLITTSVRQAVVVFVNHASDAVTLFNQYDMLIDYIESHSTPPPPPPPPTNGLPVDLSDTNYVVHTHIRRYLPVCPESALPLGTCRLVPVGTEETVDIVDERRMVQLLPGRPYGVSMEESVIGPVFSIVTWDRGRLMCVSGDVTKTKSVLQDMTKPVYFLEIMMMM